MSIVSPNRLNLEHAFQCTVGDPSDVSYVFPVPPDAAVHAFHVEVNGRELEGVVREKAMAKAEFEQALSQNRSAALLQQENVESTSLSFTFCRQALNKHMFF